MTTRIYLTGPLAVEHDGVVALNEAGLRGRQTRLALAYLVVERSRSVSRMELVSLLWPESTPPAWEAGLSAVISRLRRAVSRIPGARLDGAAGRCQLHLPADAWVDLECAIESLDSAEAALRAGKPRAAFGPAAVASTIARRPFLADMDSPWATGQRSRLKRISVRALEVLAQIWIATDEPHLAVETASEMVAEDGLYERGYQLLMDANARTGHPANALLAYRRLREVLRSELGIDPSADTQRMYEAIIR
jgi:SARP family transcriptional regulator, regulator of embCAB operon